ncbi:MAG: hypothetical protein Q9M97_03080 [Candidatus Gracilibacteria bacterium]|nr:hypothetical protein [Candidatus Gracilibacteria bacterium]
MKNKSITKKIITIIIIFIILGVILFFGFIFKGKTFNEGIFSLNLGYINWKSSKKDDLVLCPKLNNNDIKELNNSFSVVGLSGGLDYWCNMQIIKILNNKNIISSLPKEMGKLNNLQELIISSYKN